MEARNPACCTLSSDLNSINTLLLGLDIIFLSQLLCVIFNFGPSSEEVNLDINVEFSSYIRIKSPAKLALNY